MGCRAFFDGHLIIRESWKDNSEREAFAKNIVDNGFMHELACLKSQ